MGKLLRRAEIIINTTNGSIGRVVSWLMAIIMVLILYEITSRSVFNDPTIWVHETTQHLFGAYVFLGGAYALLKNAHVSVDVVTARLSPRTRAILAVVTSVLFFLFCYVLIKNGLDMGLRSLRFMEKNATAFASPLYPLKLLIPVAATLLLLQGLVKFFNDIKIIKTGKE